MSSRATMSTGKMNLGSGSARGLAGATTALARLSAESPRLLAEVDRLAPLAGDPDVDLDAATAPDETFTFRKAMRPFSVPLLIGAGLVLVDALTSLTTPALIRRGIDDGVVAGSTTALWGACAALLGIQLISWVNAAYMTFQTSRTAERILLSLRARRSPTCSDCRSTTTTTRWPGGS